MADNTASDGVMLDNLITDQTPPQFVVNPSTVLAMMKTIGSLLTFAVMFSTALVGFARDLDLAGAIRFVQREDVVKGLAAAATALWLFWRSTAARRKKIRDAIIVRSAPNHVAVLSTDLFQPPAPTRADSREPTKATRLVDRSVLFGGGPLPPIEPDPQPVFTYDAGAVTIADHSDPKSVVVHGPIPSQTSPLNDAEFEQEHADWLAAGGEGSFGDYLRDNGWTYTDRRWSRSN